MTGWVILSSDYINAWGLADVIRNAGWSGRIVCLRRSEGPATLMSLYGHGVEVWDIPKGGGLIELLATRIPTDERKWFFSTEEQSVEELCLSENLKRLENTVFYPASECRLDQILDRYLFYDLIATKGHGEVPKTVDGAQDPFGAFENQFFFRYRRTWVRGLKTPRIRLIQGRAQWDEVVRSGKAQGYGPEDWCYQEALSLVPEDNVSVCGWHDASDPRYVATRKVLQFPERQGNGDVVELLPLAPELTVATRKLLDELRFTGPFELEFVRDTRSGSYFVIELNPRFWMQHPLAGANLDQTLVRRYLGISDARVFHGRAPLYWVNTVVALNRLLRGDGRGLRYFRDARAIRVPPLSVALRWLPRRAMNLLCRRRAH